jgi:hypothetical protein
VHTPTATGEDATIEIKPYTTTMPNAKYSEPISIKLDVAAQVASGSFDYSKEENKLQMKIFKEDAPTLVELDSYDEILTPISNKHSVLAEPASENLNNYWTKLDIKSSLLSKSALEKATALNLNFMIPENADLFGIFSIYLEIPEGKLDSKSKQQMPSGPYQTESGEEIPG